MVTDKIDDCLIDFAVEMYFEGEHLILLEKGSNGYIVVTKMLPFSN